MKHPSTPGAAPVYTQLAGVMQHVRSYQFRGISRLARDAGISKATLSRLLAGKHAPKFQTVARVASALEAALRRPVDPRDIVREDQDFRRTPCEVCGCKGCLPAQAFDREGHLVEAFRGVEPGSWTVAHIDAARGGRRA